MKKILFLITFLLCFANTYSQNAWVKVGNFDHNGGIVGLETKDSTHCVLLLNMSDCSLMYFSSNGGYNWKIILDNYKIFDRNYPVGIAMPDTNEIFVLYRNYMYDKNENPYIIKYDNKGKIIDTLYLNFELKNYQTRDYEFKMIDRNIGIITMESKLFATSDGWRTYKEFNPYKIEIPISWKKLAFITNEEHFGCHGSIFDSTFYYTNDGGLTFNQYHFDFRFTVEKIHFVNDSVGYLLGTTRSNPNIHEDIDIVYKTIDGGKSWFKQLDTSFTNYIYRNHDIDMINENEGMYVSDGGGIVMTNDGFKTILKDTLRYQKSNWERRVIAYAGNRPIIAIVYLAEIYTRIDTVNVPMTTLINPINNSLNQNTSLKFNWETSESINKAVFQIANDKNFQNIIASDTISIPSFHTSFSITKNNLPACKRFYWRASALKSNFTKWSETWTFQTLIETPVLQYPKNKSEITLDTLEFRWQLAKNAERYLCQVSLDSLFESLIYSQDTLRINRLTLSDLPKEKQLYWRARTYCSESYGSWSNIFNFKIKDLSTIEDNGYSDKIIISPNPATEYITINLSSIDPTLKRGVEGEVVVEIYDVMGVLIHSTPSASQPHLNEGNLRINIENLSPGVYFVKIGDKVEKFVKM